MRAFMSETPAIGRLAGMMFGVGHSQKLAEVEARAILAVTEPATEERWDLEAFTPGCFRYAFPGAVACGEAYILEAPAALAEALAAFVEA